MVRSSVRLALLFAVSLAAPSFAQGAAPTSAAGDSAAVVATVNRLHAALEAGDSAAVLALLTEDVAILESGGIENRAEYRGHHLPADIEFARAIKAERKLQAVTVAGDAAWVSSTSSTRGEFKGRPVNSAGAELIVLRRSAGTWRIAAIHWSSRRRSS